MGKGSTPAPVAVQAEPLKGQGYAQLQSSSDVPLALRCTQKLWLAPKLSAKLFAMFSQVDGKAEEPRMRLQVKHKGNISLLDTRVSVRARYDHARRVTKGTVYLKKRVELGPHTALNAKVELHQRMPIGGDKVDQRGADGEVQARVELSHVALNATSSQDFRVRVGLDLLNHVAYGEVRENRLTVKGDTKGQWSVVYDL